MKILFPFIALLLLLSFSCKKNKQEEDASSFDKKSLLTNLADNIIQPRIQEFKIKMEALEMALIDFEGNKTSTNFNALILAQQSAYISWQKLNPFDIGPIRDNGIKSAMNTYPVDTAKVLNNIQNGNYALGNSTNVTAIGFPALDFLLHRRNAMENSNNQNYLQYIKDLIAKMKSETLIISTQWPSYRTTFISQDGTESTSSFSQLVNEFNRDFELCKNAKVGIPMGKQSLGIPLPEYFESRYGYQSKDLLLANIESLRDLYEGKGGVGFDDYLVQLNKTELANKISNQFNAIISAVKSINGSLTSAVENESQKLEDLYLLMSQQVVNIKTDMTSSFGVLITYQDSDGD